MSGTNGSWERTPMADRFADAMLEGLQWRNRFHTPSADPPPIPHLPPPPDLWDTLYPLGGVRGMPAPPARGLLGRVKRLLQRAVKWAVNPWLDQQTHFNFTTAKLVDAAVRALHHHAAATAATATAATIGRGELVSAALRVNDYLATREGLSGVPGGADTAGLARAALLDLFVTSHLPAPPAFLRLVGRCDPLGFELAHLGYVVDTAPDGLPAGGLANRVDTVVLVGDDGGLDLAGIAPAVVRGLKDGGRVVGVLAAGDQPPTPDQLARWLAPLRVTVWQSARAVGGGWVIQSGGAVADLTLFAAQ